MARARKLGLVRICDAKLRRATYLKRKKGLKKKLFELTTLCGVEASMLCFGSNGEIDTWPEQPDSFNAVIERYERLGKSEKDKHKIDISGFLDSHKKKLEEELNRARRENSSFSEFLYPCWDSRLDSFTEDSLRELGILLESKLEKVRERVEFLKMDQMINCEEGKQSIQAPIQVPVVQTEYYVSSYRGETMIFQSNCFNEIGSSSDPLRVSMCNPSGFGTLEDVVLMGCNYKKDCSVFSFDQMGYQSQPLQVVLPSAPPPLLPPPSNFFHPHQMHQFGDDELFGNYYSQDFDIKPNGHLF